MKVVHLEPSLVSGGAVKVSLLPVEIKATSHGFPPTSLAGRYNNTPKSGSIDNLISVWPGEELVLNVSPNELFSSDSSTGLITWSAPGFTIPDGSSEHTFSWLDTGVKTIIINVGTIQFKVVVDVPNAGGTSQTDAALAIDPIAAATILLDSQLAESLVTNLTGSQQDAMRHAYWNALSLSDSYVTFDELLSSPRLMNSTTSGVMTTLERRRLLNLLLVQQWICTTIK